MEGRLFIAAKDNPPNQCDRMTQAACRAIICNVKIEKAHELGFCFGVRRALKIIEEAAVNHVNIATLGPIVHNKAVVSRLKKLGVEVAGDVESISAEVIAISSHGVSPSLHDKIQSAGARIIDTTCPIVRSAQKAAQRFARAGFGVIVFGDSNHPEVRGLLGWAGGNAVAALSADNICAETIHKRVGILAQTTQSMSDYSLFVNRLTERFLPCVQEIRVVNSLCQETQKRQRAAAELAETSDLMIVVGGHNSANTRRLAEVCSPIVETHHVESASEVMPEWLKGKNKVGITAGTSTPDEAIEQVIRKIKASAA